MSTPALELRKVTKTFAEFVAVDAVDLIVPANQIIGLVGESGSGKTTTGLLAMRLQDVVSGQVLLHGKDITTLDQKALRPHRREMQFIFQDSYSALDPMMTLAEIVAEPLFIHKVGEARQRYAEALDWLDRVGLAREYGQRYPHELSGGQRQRVAVARALILKPKVLVADEPTSALDVSVKAQIVNLLQDLQAEMGLSILFISHDLSVVRSLTDKVVVMYHGRVVEKAPTEDIFQKALHPYTRSLLDAIPIMDPRKRKRRTFVTAKDIANNIPRLAAGALIGKAIISGDAPQLVEARQGHFVEAFVDGLGDRK